MTCNWINGLALGLYHMRGYPEHDIPATVIFDFLVLRFILTL